MIFRVLLYERAAPEAAVGSVEVRHLMVTRPSDYQCCPEGLLTQEQVRKLGEQLRDVPPGTRGTIGEYEWVEQN